MANRTDQLETRVHVLEQLVHRLLLLVGAAGETLAEVRRPIDNKEASGS
jgi:hypothetical protein